MSLSCSIKFKKLNLSTLKNKINKKLQWKFKLLTAIFVLAYLRVPKLQETTRALHRFIKHVSKIMQSRLI